MGSGLGSGAARRVATSPGIPGLSVLLPCEAAPDRPLGARPDAKLASNLASVLLELADYLAYRHQRSRGP